MAIGVTNGAWGALPQRQSAWDIGGKAGADVGRAVGSVMNMLKAENTEADEKEKKQRVAELVGAYADPNSQTFQNLKGSARTRRLVQLLTPYDIELARKYEVRAKEESDDETTISRNEEIMKAGKDIATTEEVAVEGLDNVDAEIAMIVAELNSRVGTKPENVDLSETDYGVVTPLTGETMFDTTRGPVGYSPYALPNYRTFGARGM